MSTTITIDLPDELVVDLGIPAATLSEKAKEWLALELFREGRMSSGSAADWLGMERVDFIDLLGSRGVPYIDYPLEDLAREMAVVRESITKSKRN